MFRLLFVVLLIFSAVSAKSCISQDTKDPDIRVIELDDSSSKDSSESDIVTLYLPDRRRREIIKKGKKSSNFCKNDDDCGSGLICSPVLTCVKGTRRAVYPQKTAN
ncbi:PREDICTED: uncharacterized protein LOC108760517 [Trachymyrmex cornetzi]|uniref:uncharacterized protein LOC108760517 n=1 Tax=Trachymyrmex cornetzi TaxID=471704 RepID=UPI00084F4D07|nr:PREDICTED: uncharacterized protein LOC108760517 [Trachymyrmex cornetzi]